MTSATQGPVIHWREDLDHETRVSVNRALRGCKQLLPEWCRAVEVRRSSRDLELIAGWGDVPLVALPDRPRREITLLVRDSWRTADRRAREGAIAFWLSLDGLFASSVT